MKTNTNNQTEDAAVPQHILDFCNRVYPPHLGSAYDTDRVHLIAKRMLIERDQVGRDVPACTASAAPSSVDNPSEPPTASERAIDSRQRSMPSAESILATLRSQNQVEQTRNEAGIQPEQTRNGAEIDPEQSQNEAGMEPEWSRNKSRNKMRKPLQTRDSPKKIYKWAPLRGQTMARKPHPNGPPSPSARPPAPLQAN